MARTSTILHFPCDTWYLQGRHSPLFFLGKILYVYTPRSPLCDSDSLSTSSSVSVVVPRSSRQILLSRLVFLTFRYLLCSLMQTRIWFLLSFNTQLIRCICGSVVYYVYNYCRVKLWLQRSVYRCFRWDRLTYLHPAFTCELRLLVGKNYIYKDGRQLLGFWLC